MSTQTNKNSKMISKNQCVSVNVTDFYDPDLIETSQTSHSGETHQQTEFLTKKSPLNAL